MENVKLGRRNRLANYCFNLTVLSYESGMCRLFHVSHPLRDTMLCYESQNDRSLIQR